jgi:nucleotide-binding universal stress UspA family protein
MDTTDPRRILLATDFSDRSRYALDYGIMLARRLGASVHILYVSSVPEVLEGDAISLGELLIDADIKEGQKRVDLLTAEVTRSGVASCTGEVIPGFADQVIVTVANSGGYDLVVIGTHGRTGLEHLWLGTIAECVVRRAEIPVVTVRPPKNIGSPPQ